MRRASALTVVLATAGRVARADFEDGDRAPARIMPRVPGSRPADAVAAALSLGGRPTGRVLALCEDFWMQTLTLSAAQTAGLSSRDTAQALAFEVEPFSNLPPPEAAIGFHAARQPDGTNLYRVVECTRSDLDAVRDAIVRAGARPAGMSHPAALSAPPENGPPPPVADDDSIRSRLREWADAVRQQPGSLPLVVPPPVPTPAWLPVVVGLAAATAVSLLCGGHALWRTGQRGRMQRDLALAQRAAAEAQKAERGNADARTAMADMKKALQERESTRRVLAQRRGALRTLLRALATTRPAEAVLLGLREDGAWSAEATGLGVTAAAADETTSRLAAGLQDTGWTVRLTRNRASGELDNAGPWRFAYRLRLIDPWTPGTRPDARPTDPRGDL